MDYGCGQDEPFAVKHSIPPGQERVSVRISVSSEEFPEWTSQRSPFNDAWRYSVYGLPGVEANKGQVNDSHQAKQTITKEYCVDTSKLAEQGAYTFEATLEAGNVGDDDFPTFVSLIVRNHCEDLRVTSAEFSTTNPKGHRILQPVKEGDGKKGNLPGSFISIPLGESLDGWGPRLTIRYEPKDAEITDIFLRADTGDGVAQPRVSIVSQSKTISPGRIDYSSLTIPNGLAGAPFGGKVGFSVELEGMYQGKPVKSRRSDGVVEVNGTNWFTPLFPAQRFFNSDRRYGQGAADAGGDAWASQRTMSYLNGNAYRFNDISPAHVAQRTNGRSILDHGGHSDGSQIDFRYADGLGGFSDAMGGAENGRHIRNVLDLAQKEMGDGSNLARKHVQAAVDWIRSNWQLLKQEAANARILYAGDKWMKLGLLEGKYPDGTPIVLRGEEIGPWIDMPKNISFQPSHLHHWHISLNHGDARLARKDLARRRIDRAR